MLTSDLTSTDKLPMAYQDFDALDRQLDQLAEQAKQATSEPDRRLALTALFELLYKPGVLYSPQKNRHSPEEYKDLHQEALHDVILELHGYLQKYDRQKGNVRKLVNELFRYRFIDAINRRNDKRRNGSRTVRMPDFNKNPHLEPAMPDHELSDGELLREFIIEDPKGLLCADPYPGPPEVTFQTLLIRRYLDDQPWREISAELGIPISSLSTFYQRRLKKLMPIFLEFLSH